MCKPEMGASLYMVWPLVMEMGLREHSNIRTAISRPESIQTGPTNTILICFETNFKRSFEVLAGPDIIISNMSNPSDLESNLRLNRFYQVQ